MLGSFLAFSLGASLSCGLGDGATPLEDAPGCSAYCHSRPGGPRSVACYAQPSDTGRYRGDYVGGGCACHGEPSYLTEGTWGWDYESCFLIRDVFLKWCHCGRYQGGTGAYKTDGPPYPGH